MDMYRDIILDHYKHPRNFGHLPKPDAKVEEGNVTCGDRIIMEIKSTINDQRSTIITDIRFSGSGCVISQAAASMLTEKVKGMNIGDVMKLESKDVIDMLGSPLTPSRTRCATLSLEVLHKTVLSLK